jgi:hypothetical protein
MDIVLVALVFQILIQFMFLQVSSGRIYETRLMVLQFLQVHFVVRLVYNIVVESYPHLSIIAMLEAHKPHTHAPHAHAD